MTYRDLSELLAREMTTEESPETKRLIDALRGVRKRGYVTKHELLAICRWKSARAIRLCRRNSSSQVRSLSGRALSSRSEQVRFHSLTALQGVGAPMASAILMLTDPRSYGVIDVRVWRLLFDLGSVSTNRRGLGFSFANWSRYLTILRFHAARFGVTVRTIEYSLFLYQQRTQSGPLYGASKPQARRTQPVPTLPPTARRNKACS